MAKCVVRHIPRLLRHGGTHTNITTASKLRSGGNGFHRSSNILSGKYQKSNRVVVSPQ